MVAASNCVGVSFSEKAGKLVRIYGHLHGMEILEEKSSESARDLRLDQRFTYLQKNSSKLTIKDTVEWDQYME